MLGLSKVTQKLGMKTKAVKADERIFEIEQLQFPFIAHVTKKFF